MHEKTVKSLLDLLVDGATLALAVGDSLVDELGVVGLLGCSKDQGRVGGSILRLVLVNGGEVTRVTDDNLVGVSAGCVGQGQANSSDIRCR